MPDEQGFAGFILVHPKRVRSGDICDLGQIEYRARFMDLYLRALCLTLFSRFSHRFWSYLLQVAWTYILASFSVGSFFQYINPCLRQYLLPSNYIFPFESESNNTLDPERTLEPHVGLELV